MHNLELDLQVQYHNLKKLKYKYQVCATQVSLCTTTGDGPLVQKLVPSYNK